jgi:hypothetical protein
MHFQKEMDDSDPTKCSILQMVGLVELQRELIGVGKNNFLIKRVCHVLGLLQKFLHHAWGCFM